MNYLIFSTSLVRSLLKLHTIVLIFSLLSFSFLAAQSDGLNVVSPGVIAYSYQPVSGSELKEIYSVNSDGTENTKISNANISLDYPDWSPDGLKIVVTAEIDQQTRSIYTFDADDGSNLIRLTDTENVWDYEPSWSPDGSKIVFTRIFPNQNNRSEIWLMNSDGSNQQWNGILGGSAKWFPDGSRLVYHYPIGDYYHIYSCDLDGTNINQITNDSLSDIVPRVSPDGLQITFTRVDNSVHHEIYIVKIDGTGLTQVTNDVNGSARPSWSPNGLSIAFHSQAEIYTINPNGTNRFRVTTSPPGISARNPVWKPESINSNNGINENIPIEMELFPNYPNPFNPTTTISYQIPKPGFVSLKIFDVLGSEIATLVNEDKPAGNYELHFNGAQLTSGIYFYRLQTGNYSTIKKMTLIK